MQINLFTSMEKLRGYTINQQSHEIFYMLKGDMILEYMHDGQRQAQVIREGELLLVAALTPHSPHRPPDTWGAGS